MWSKEILDYLCFLFGDSGSEPYSRSKIIFRLTKHLVKVSAKTDRAFKDLPLRIVPSMIVLLSPIKNSLFFRIEKITNKLDLDLYGNFDLFVFHLQKWVENCDAKCSAIIENFLITWCCIIVLNAFLRIKDEKISMDI